MVSKFFATKVFLILLVFARKTESLECYKCSNLTDINQCNNVIQCSSDQSCFHDTYSIGQSQVYSLGCIDKHQCSTNDAVREAIGVVGRALQGRTNLCHECCSTDKCNKPLCEHFNPSACIDDHKIDCAYLNTVTNICSDIQHARTICPRFCDLCNISISSSKSTSSFTNAPTKSTFTTRAKPSTLKSASLLTTGTTVRTSTATSNMSVLKGHIELCPNRTQQLAAQSGDELLAQFGQNCYEVVQSSVSWSHAETNCKKYGGHLIHIANQQEQDFIYNFLVKHHTHTVWLGLNDRNTEENFEWTSGDNVTYENFKPGRKDFRDHNYEDCVFMTPTTGEWDDVECGGNNPLAEIIQGIRHAYICQYAIIKPVFDGNIKMCPHRFQQLASRDNANLAQHDQSCYELVPNTKVSWQHAEEMCKSRGGHLVDIGSAEEQSFVQNFMNTYLPDHAVWIGLTDNNTEGVFHWTSGKAVHYTNWVPGHSGNFVSSSQEDCVALIPYKNGQWDDIPCGHTYHSLFGHASSSGETHPPLCEYSTSSGPAIIG